MVHKNTEQLKFTFLYKNNNYIPRTNFNNIPKKASKLVHKIQKFAKNWASKIFKKFFRIQFYLISQKYLQKLDFFRWRPCWILHLGQSWCRLSTQVLLSHGPSWAKVSSLQLVIIEQYHYWLSLNNIMIGYYWTIDNLLLLNNRQLVIIEQ